MKMMNAVNQKDENIYSLTERVEPKYLSGSDGRDEEINPHAFIDPAVGVKMAEDMRDALIANTQRIVIKLKNKVMRMSSA